MLSAVGESVQVALQATTIVPSPQVAAAVKVDNRTADKSAESVGGGGRAKGDTVTISAEAKQLTSAALNATDESQESPKEKSKEKSKEESAGKK